MPSSLHTRRYEIFRELLISSREAAGLTQTQIAHRMGKPQSFVSKYERGERRLDFTEFIELVDILALDEHEFIRRYRAALMAIQGLAGGQTRKR